MGSFSIPNIAADTGILAQGIQQAYEISVLKEPVNPVTALVVEIYPNPVTTKLILDVWTYYIQAVN